jgi:hypothetical protein
MIEVKTYARAYDLKQCNALAAQAVEAIDVFVPPSFELLVEAVHAQEIPSPH